MTLLYIAFGFSSFAQNVNSIILSNGLGNYTQYRYTVKGTYQGK